MTEKTVKDLTAGTFGGICQVLIGQPFDIIKVRMQTAPAGTYTGMLSCAKGILSNEGPLAFYKGTLSPLIGIGACVSIQFGAMEYTKGYFASSNRMAGVGGNDGTSLTATQLLASGAIAGLANAVVSCPVEHVRIRLQVQSNINPTYSGPWSVVTKSIKSAGLPGLFKGQSITFLRDSSGYSAYFLVYETLIQSHLAKLQLRQPQTHENENRVVKRNEIPAMYAMLYGAIAGYALWAVIYPIDVVKTRIQTDGFGSSDADKRRYRGSWDCARKVWVGEGGYRAFLRGLGPTLVRSPFANGATFLGFEMASRALGS